MRNVDDHAERVHFVDHFQTERRQTLRVLLRIVVARIAHGVWKSPEQREQAYTHIVDLLDPFDLAVYEDAVLDGQERRQIPFLGIFADIRCTVSRAQDILVFLHFGNVVFVNRLKQVVRIHAFHFMTRKIDRKKLSHAAVLLHHLEIQMSLAVAQCAVFVPPALDECVAVHI